MPNRIFLLDGYALLYRAHFAFIHNPMFTTRGEPTSALFGLMLQLSRLIEENQPGHLAMVLDTSRPTFRHLLYPDYKATREKMPDDLRSQVAWARELVSEGLCIPILELEGFEADDVIGAISRRAAEAGYQAVIVSGDKDFYQLVSEGIHIYNQRPRGEESEWVDPSNAVEKFGVPPAQVVDFLALTGDSSDNVPGVRGIGKVGALKLLKQFGSLDAIYARLDEIDSWSLRGKLEASREAAFLSRELVTIHTELPIPFEPERLRRCQPDRQRLAELFHRFEFRSMYGRFGLEGHIAGLEGREPPPPEKSYRAVESVEELERLAEEIRRAGRFAVDVETTGLDAVAADPVGISLSWRPHEGWYIPLAHEEAPNLPLDQVRRVLGPLLADPAVGCVGQNIKYDMIVLERAGMPVRGVVGDPMVASYLLDPGERSHGLDALALAVLGHKTITYEEVAGKGRQMIPFARVPLARAVEYSGEDADLALLLEERLRERLEAVPELVQLYREVELPLIPVLARMETVGVAIDAPYLAVLSRKMEGTLRLLEEEVWKLAGHEFNVNSPIQLSQVLFEELGIKPGKKTKTGFSTDSSVLEALAVEHELPRLMLELREVAKLKSTYVDALPRQVNPRTGRIHTSFNQVVTATGRLSSSDPNLQNIPIRTEEGRAIRRAFIPAGPERVLFCADYSQIELRILAHLAGDQQMIEAFSKGMDIHTETASRSDRGPAGEGPALAAQPGQDHQFRGALRDGRAPACRGSWVSRSARPGSSSRTISPVSRGSATTSTARSTRPAARAGSRPSSAGGGRCPRSAATTGWRGRTPSGWRSTPRSRARPRT